MSDQATDRSTGILNRLFRTHQSTLARFFNRHAPDKSEVPDLTQEVFLKLSRSEVPDALDNSGGYVISVARSVLIDHHRRRQVRRAADHTGLDNLDVESTDLPADRVLDSKAIAERVQVALLTLPERTRDVFALRTIRGMKMADVAETMRISLSTAEKHHARALAYLAEQLADFY